MYTTRKAGIKMKRKIQALTEQEIERKIITIRGQEVILDRDIAELYGVKTKEINQAVKNNSEKFPEGYVLTLNKDERTEVVKIFDHLEYSKVIENCDNSKIKFSPVLPKAFTKKGLYMLATILKSQFATQTTIAIVETFAKMRELSRSLAALTKTSEKEAQKSLIQKSSEIISDILTNNLQVSGAETSVEINLAVLKIKHSIQQKRRT